MSHDQGIRRNSVEAGQARFGGARLSRSRQVTGTLTNLLTNKFEPPPDLEMSKNLLKLDVS